MARGTPAGLVDRWEGPLPGLVRPCAYDACHEVRGAGSENESYQNWGNQTSSTSKLWPNVPFPKFIAIFNMKQSRVLSLFSGPDLFAKQPIGGRSSRGQRTWSVTSRRSRQSPSWWVPGEKMGPAFCLRFCPENLGVKLAVKRKTRKRYNLVLAQSISGHLQFFLVIVLRSNYIPSWMICIHHMLAFNICRFGVRYFSTARHMCHFPM